MTESSVGLTELTVGGGVDDGGGGGGGGGLKLNPGPAVH